MLRADRARHRTRRPGGASRAARRPAQAARPPAGRRRTRARGGAQPRADGLRGRADGRGARPPFRAELAQLRRAPSAPSSCSCARRARACATARADRRRRARRAAGADRPAGLRRRARDRRAGQPAPALRARPRRGPLQRPPAGDRRRRRRPSWPRPSTPRAENLQRATDRHLAELDAVFRDSPLGIAFLDLDLRFVRVNEALARMNQVPADEHLGRSVGEVTGQYDIERALRRVVETGEPMLDVDIALARPPVRGQLLRRPRRPRRAARGRQGDDRRDRAPPGRGRARAPAGRRRPRSPAAVTVADVARVTIEQSRLALDADMARRAELRSPSASGWR